MKAFSKFFESRVFVSFAIIFLTLTGFFLRLANLSQFKIYPDAYQSLLVAKNIVTYHSVVGFLGNGGLLYPDFFAWTRPGFPVLIDFVSLVTKNSVFPAQLLSFSFGVLVIPLSYFLMKKIFGSPWYGLAAALLTTLSFNLTIWSGLIMTETTGVVFMILFLLSLFSEKRSEFSVQFSDTRGVTLSSERLGKEPNNQWLDWRDLLTGFLCAVAILTRYEYIVLLIPVGLFILFTTDKGYIKIFNILISFGMVFSFSIAALFPVHSLLPVVINQTRYMLLKLSILVSVGVLAIILFWILKRVRDDLVGFWKPFLIILLWLCYLFLLLQIFFPTFQFLRSDLTFIRNFIARDFLVSFFSVVGFSFLLYNKKIHHLALFAGASILLLMGIYHNINPAIDRYMTHTLPFLLILASYGVVRIFQSFFSKKYFGIVFCILFALCTLFQGVVSAHGIRYLNDNSWFRVSYEEKSAFLLKKYLNSTDLLIVSLPEPYFLDTGKPTQSIADSLPFIFFSNNKNTRVMIVEDMGMHIIFPKFSLFLENHMQQYKTSSYWVHEKYHYIDKSYPEKYPVVLYQTSLANLLKIKNQ